MISIIVPIYNAEKYLRECLDSLVNQTYKNVEVLMVNDGSTDGSEAICREYEKRYSNFRLLNKVNGGQMSAWILGVHEAKGEYFGFVDSDDKVAPNMYEVMMKRQEQTGADLVMCNFFDWNIQEATPRNRNFKPFYSGAEMQEIYNLVFPTLNTYFSMSRWDKLFKKDIYLENTEKYCDYIARTFEDRFIVTPYVFSCKSFAYVDEPLYYWRKCKVSSSRKPRPELCDIMENLYARQMKMLKDKGIYEQYRDRLEIGKIDLMRSVIERNLGARIPYVQKKEIAGLILTQENRRIVTEHRDACTGKFGKYIYWVCKLNSKWFMITGEALMQKSRKSNNDKAFG